MLRTSLVLLAVLAGCGSRYSPDRRADRPELPDPQVSAQPAQRLPERPGMEALGGWALKCYDIALKHNSIFGRGGNVVIRWAADRNGDLLHLDFATDTFRGWEINSQGETLADCITRAAREGKVRWSPTGLAPLRLRPAS
jgi:hypothetical protein